MHQYHNSAWLDRVIDVCLKETVSSALAAVALQDHLISSWSLDVGHTPSTSSNRLTSLSHSYLEGRRQRRGRVSGMNCTNKYKTNQMAVLYGMPTIQYSTWSARLSVWRQFTSCIRRYLVSCACNGVMSALSAVLLIYSFQFRPGFLPHLSGFLYRA